MIGRCFSNTKNSNNFFITRSGGYVIMSGNEYKDLDKIGCARQFESELSLHSLALFL